MPRKVRILKWEPKKEPMTVTVHYAVSNPALLAEIAVKKLQQELLGAGCGCHRAEELIGLLRDLGCEVQIEETKRNEITN
jgi:hypothetical protein